MILELNSLRPYSKRELAMLYFPETEKVESAVKHLCRSIHNDPNLWNDLCETHYNPRNRGFTIRQVAILFQYLGKP